MKIINSAKVSTNLVIAFTFWSVIVNSGISHAQKGSLTGKVSEIQTNEPLPFASIILEQNGIQIKGTTSNIDGIYWMDSLKPGDYTLRALFVGYEPLRINRVTIIPAQTDTVNLKLTASALQIQGIEVSAMGIRQMKRNSVSAQAITKVTSSGNKPVIMNHRVTEREHTAEAGKLTASELNDFGKWDLWQDIEKNDLKSSQRLWKISPVSRYCVQLISNNNHPVVDAVVTLESDKGNVHWKARTDNTGKAELWTGMFDPVKRSKLNLHVDYEDQHFDYPSPNPISKGINICKIPVACKLPQEIDIAFVVDATGSMEDEIAFLKAELVNIIDNTKKFFPGNKVNLGSVFYRCFGNSYATRVQQFTENIAEIDEFIQNQDAGEGGDEVVEEGLKAAIDELNWSSSARERLLFLILDQQPLTNKSVIEKVNHYIQIAAMKGIRIIPVIASAETPENASSLEYLMRSIALATNGTYVFLTDHSNIGNTHAKPVTDEYDVELLNSLIKRLIYQFGYIPACNSNIETHHTTDTVLILKKVIAHEVIDPLRKSKAVDPRLIYLNTMVVQESPEISADHQSDSSSLVPAADPPSQGNPDSKSAEILKIYPNPTQGIITVEFTGEIDELYLTDLSGKLISRYKPGHKSKLEIDLSSFSTGIYFLRFKDPDGWNSARIILTH